MPEPQLLANKSLHTIKAGTPRQEYSGAVYGHVSSLQPNQIQHQITAMLTALPVVSDAMSGRRQP